MNRGEERLRSALEAGGIGIWEYDFRTLKVTWDERARSIYGFPSDLEVTRVWILSCAHIDDRPRLEEWLECFRKPVETGDFEIQYRIVNCRSSSIQHVYARGRVTFTGTGGRQLAAHASGILQDVTALKRDEEALQRVNIELEQFAYTAAHDLIEPLRNVGLATQILASTYKGRLGEDADTLLKIAMDGPTRMIRMVKDLLAYSRAVSADPVSTRQGLTLLTDSNAALALALKNLLIAIQEKEAHVTWETLPKLRMSELHLVQIFQNLIGNALKYSGDRRPSIHIAVERRAGECVLYVSDNGIGIAPQHHDRAFGIFKRLHDSNVPGTGIGLTLCKRIVEHYGGRIWIESQVGQGTMVLFTPPAAEEALGVTG